MKIILGKLRKAERDFFFFLNHLRIAILDGAGCFLPVLGRWNLSLEADGWMGGPRPGPEAAPNGTPC